MTPPLDPSIRQNIAKLYTILTGQSEQVVLAHLKTLSDPQIQAMQNTISEFISPSRLFTGEAISAVVVGNPELFTVNEMLAYIASLAPEQAFPEEAGTAKLATWAGGHMAAVASYEDGLAGIVSWLAADQLAAVAADPTGLAALNAWATAAGWTHA